MIVFFFFLPLLLYLITLPSFLPSFFCIIQPPISLSLSLSLHSSLHFSLPRSQTSHIMEEEDQLNNTDVNDEQPSLHTKPDADQIVFYHDADDIDSSCSTPFVSAPSSPGRDQPHTIGPAFFYSAPSSPMHFILSSSSTSMPNFSESSASTSTSYEFEFSARFGTLGTVSGGGGGSMSSADELFLNGQIRPMKLSSHLQRPQALEPLLDLDESQLNNNELIGRGRDVKWRDRSLRRRARSMSPLRTQEFDWHHDDDDEAAAADGNNNDNVKSTEEISEAAAAAALESKHDEPVLGQTRISSSASRNSSSKRWISLKDLLYRSKSEGRNNGHKFWSAISFSPVKDKKAPSSSTSTEEKKESANSNNKKNKKAAVGGGGGRKATNGVVVGGGGGGGKKRVPLSPHEVHYKASKAQAEEMRKKTYLPYRQGLLGCLGFSSKSYGAMNGFARALNPVSSR